MVLNTNNDDTDVIEKLLRNTFIVTTVAQFREQLLNVPFEARRSSR
jgi:hypothetical protein